MVYLNLPVFPLPQVILHENELCQVSLSPVSLAATCACLIEICFTANGRICSKFLIKPNFHVHIETNLKQIDHKYLAWCF